MNIVVLTNNGSLYGKKILNKFISSGIKVEAILVIKQPFEYYWKLFKYVLKRVGFLDALIFSIKRCLASLLSKEPITWNNQPFISDYNKLGTTVFNTKETNSDETLDIFKKFSPDILILGQTGIVKKQLLEIPKIGTLNAHPAILPYYRGIDCAQWAIYNNEFHKIGSSVHWVDSGVDTGNIILKEVYKFSGNETFDTIDDTLHDQCIELLIKVIFMIQSKRKVSGEPQNNNEGNQYYKISRKYESIAQKKLSAFLSQTNE